MMSCVAGGQVSGPGCRCGWVIIGTTHLNKLPVLGQGCSALGLCLGGGGVLPWGEGAYDMQGGSDM